MTESLLPGWARRIRRQLATRFRIKIIPRPQKDSLRPVPERSLLDLARAEGWQLDPADEKFLWRLERRLKNRTTGEVAVLIDARSESLAAAMAERFPNLTIRAISSSGDRPDRRRAQPIEGLPAHKFSTPASQRHEILTAFGPFHFIVDSVAGSAEPQLTRMREVFFHLKPQGLYIATADRSTSTNGTESVTGFLARMIELRSSGLDRTDSHPDELSFAKALGTVIIEDGMLIAQCTQPAMPKLRDFEVDQVLELRPSLGQVLLQRPRLDFQPRGKIRANHPGFNHRFTPIYHVPPVSLRSYFDVLAAPHQVLVAEQILLPDSYRHHTQPRLTNRFLEEVAPRFALYPKQSMSWESLSGAYFYLGSEWPRHFGHLMTEVMSRLWAWPEAKARFPNLKALLPLPSGHHEPAEFETALFTAAGIDAADLKASPGTVRVETLLAATPMFVNADYIHPEIAEVWRRLGRALLANAPARDYPEKLFCSRRRRYKRACHNLEEVENVFRRHGFAIVYPEDYPCAEQAAMFESARVVAGFGGSAMFNLLFCTSPKRVVLIFSESYTARNEYMIASVLGHQIDLIWCTPDLPHPVGKWSSKAFASGFTFDFDRDGHYLEDLLRTV